jgi:glycosidase
MNDLILFHTESREYIYPITRNRLNVKLKCITKQDVICQIVIWDRFKEDAVKKLSMRYIGSDGCLKNYECDIVFDGPARYLKYYFVIYSEEKYIFLGRNCLSDKKPDHPFEYSYTNEEDIFYVPHWADGAVVYQIFPDRFFNGDKSNDPPNISEWGSKPTVDNFFGGDLKGIIAKLDYLSDLGIDAIYLNPIFKATSNHKYDTVNYYEVDPSFGDISDLKELVNKCHDHNIKVILDGVFNHCGFYFAPFQDVLSNGGKSKFKDWFYIDNFPICIDPPNYECVGYYKWMPKLRFKNREVRDYFLDVGTYWIKTADIDGWRLDVADEVDFTFWQEFRRAIKNVKKDAILIAETWKDGKDMLRGDQMDSIMNYLFRDALVDYFALNKIDTYDFDQIIQNILLSYPNIVNNVLYNLIGSHDTPRFMELCKGDIRKMQLAVAFQMTFVGMPAIYYGDEIGLTGGNDPDCRMTMNWENNDQILLEFYRKIIKTRKNLLPLRYGDFRSIYCDKNTYGFSRHFNGESIYIIFNNNKEEKLVEMPAFEYAPNLTCFRDVMGNISYKPFEIRNEDVFYNYKEYNYKSSFKVLMPAYSFKIIKPITKQ